MIDLFEKVRPEIPSKYRKLAEEGMGKVNDLFDETFLKSDDNPWGRIPWFDRLEYIEDEGELCMTMLYDNPGNCSLLMTLCIDVNSGDTWMVQVFSVDGKFYSSWSMNLVGDDCEDYTDHMFDNAIKVFEKDRIEINNGDEVIYSDGLDLMRGIVKGVSAERYEVDFGDFEVYEEIEYFTSAKHWAFPEGSVSQ